MRDENTDVGTGSLAEGVPVYTVPIWGPERDFRPTPAFVFDATQFPWAYF
jgi:hypothetical protein